MAQIVGTYTQIDSPVHRAHAGLKLAFLVAYSVALFLGHTWLALGMFAACFMFVLLAAKIPIGSFMKSLAPLYVMLAFVLLFNSLAYAGGVDGGAAGVSSLGASGGGASDVLFAMGPCLFVKSGLIRGIYYCARILLLVGMSMVVCASCTTKELSDTLSVLFAPLARFGFPAQDASMVVALALRFIPLMSEQLQQIRDAQASRGARFESGGLVSRLKAWSNVMIPLFVGMFRRADNLALALDARCYGAGPATSRGQIKGPTRRAGAPSPFGHRFACVVACVAVLLVGTFL